MDEDVGDSRFSISAQLDLQAEASLEGLLGCKINHRMSMAMMILCAVSSGSAPPPPMANGHTAAAEKLEQGEHIALNPRKKQQFKLIEKCELSHNVRRFR